MRWKGAFAGHADAERVTATLDFTPKAGDNLIKHIENLKRDMLKAAENLEFEEAARLRDEISRLEEADLLLGGDMSTPRPDVARMKEARSQAGRAGHKIVKGKSQKRRF